MRNRGRRRNGETEDGIKGKKGENVEEKRNGVYKKREEKGDRVIKMTGERWKCRWRCGKRRKLGMRERR